MPSERMSSTLLPNRLTNSPPVLSVTDALVASQWADGMVCVVREKLSTNRRLAKTLERLGQSTAPLVGLVVNGVRPLASSGTYYPQSADRRGKGGVRRRLRFGRRKERAVLTITDWEHLMTDDSSDRATQPSNGRNGAGVVEQGSTAAADSEPPKGE